MTSHSIEWAAGFFEGEGYVGWNKGYNKEVKKNYPKVVVQISQVYREPLDKFQEVFGAGSVRGPYGPYNGTKQPYYQYQASNWEAIMIIQKMLPYLFRKGDQAREVLSKYEKYHNG